MSEETEFSEREKQLIRSAIKSQRFNSDEYYELYEKLNKWWIN